MRYSLLRVRKRLWYHWKQYLLIIAEYAVGIAILIMCLNILQSQADALAELERSMEDGIYNISSVRITPVGNSETDTFSIHYDTYLELEKEFPDMRFYFANAMADYDMLRTDDQESQVVMKHIFFMNENNVQRQLGDQQTGYALIGEKAYQNLLKAQQDGNLRDYMGEEKGFYLENDRFYLREDVSYPVMRLDREGWISYTSGIAVTDSSKIPYAECIFLPLEAMQELPDRELLSCYSILGVQLADEQNTADLELVLTFLDLEETDYEFRVSDSYATTRNSFDSYTYEYGIWKWCGIIILALVVLTVIGMFALIYMKRQKAVAVAVSFGEKNGMVWFEHFIETATVLLIGWMIGVAGGEVLTAHGVNSYFAVYAYSDFIWWTLLLSLCCAAVTVPVAGGKVNRQKLPLVMRDL